MYVTCFEWVPKTSNCTGSQSLSYDCKLIKFYEINSVSLFISYVLAVCIYICAQRSAVEYRHLISGTRSSKCCRLLGQMLGKMELFGRIVVFRLWIHSDLRKLRVEIAHFKKYGSCKCLVQVNCVSPFIIIILIRSKN